MYLNRNPQTGKQREERLNKIELNIQDLWDNNKMHNIHTVNILKGQERDKETEEILKKKMMTKNFLK